MISSKTSLSDNPKAPTSLVLNGLNICLQHWMKPDLGWDAYSCQIHKQRWQHKMKKTISWKDVVKNV
jgi:hypothetical protein